MALRDNPYILLNVQDYLTDEKLSCCSLAAQGVYVRILCVLHKSETYGGILFREIPGKDFTVEQFFSFVISERAGVDLEAAGEAVSELLSCGVLSIKKLNGVDFLFHEGMIRENEVSEKRSVAGKRGARKRYESCGDPQDEFCHGKTDFAIANEQMSEFCHGKTDFAIANEPKKEQNDDFCHGKTDFAMANAENDKKVEEEKKEKEKSPPYNPPKEEREKREEETQNQRAHALRTREADFFSPANAEKSFIPAVETEIPFPPASEEHTAGKNGNSGDAPMELHVPKGNRKKAGGPGNEPPTCSSAPRFIPPSVEAVEAYCLARKNGIDAHHFCDFYQSKGWLVGKNKMKDWKAAVRTWEVKRREQGGNPTSMPPLGAGVWIVGTQKFYGDRASPVEIPFDAPRRPDVNHFFNPKTRAWEV